MFSKNIYLFGNPLLLIRGNVDVPLLYIYNAKEDADMEATEAAPEEEQEEEEEAAPKEPENWKARCHWAEQGRGVLELL